MMFEKKRKRKKTTSPARRVARSYAEGPAERLERILETIDWREMGNVRAASIKVDNSFSLGMATKSLQKTGPFATPFAFKQGPPPRVYLFTRSHLRALTVRPFFFFFFFKPFGRSDTTS